LRTASKQYQGLEAAKQKLQNTNENLHNENEKLRNANEKLQNENEKLQNDKKKLVEENNKLQMDVGAGLNDPTCVLETAADIFLSHKELGITRNYSRKETNGTVAGKVPR
jgi:predicted nuclease with TOPRIM domain